MVYSFDYDTSYIPSIPVVEIEVTSERDEPGVHLRAIVDSGADATIVPMRYLLRVQARKGEKAWLRGTAQQRILVAQYKVWLHIRGLRPLYLQAVGDAQGQEAILGRDVLNQLIVTLNGLASVVEISD
jgi:hypothetical protein